MIHSVYNLHFHCRWTSPAKLPAFSGPILYRALNRTLKGMFCTLKSQKCESCVLEGSCPYPALFPGSGEKLHPLVLHPPLSASCEADTPFDFSILLLGLAVEYVPHFIHALQILGEAGLGAGAREGQGRFLIERITNRNHLLYEHKTGFLEAMHGAEENFYPEAIPVQSLTSMKVQFLTPMQREKPRELCQVLPFYQLIEEILHRISSLEKAFKGKILDGDFDGLLKRAKGIRTSFSDLSWREKPDLFGGVQGEVIYSGMLNEFFPLLTLGEQMNIGQKPFMGLGEIALRNKE